MRRNRTEKTKKVAGARLKIAIVVSRYNSDITDALLQGALLMLKENKVKPGNIEIIYTPGSFEIPLAVKRMARSKKYDGIITLGSIVRGETDHDFFLATAVTNALMNIQVEQEIPVGLGVLTTNNLAQARVRSKGAHNTGRKAAMAVLEMI
jgi:6,7-dimethyl-8-ribityllumazine synthase